MALELFGGAVLGAFVGELLKAVLDARQKASGFQPSLARLESTLKLMIQRLDQIRHLNNQLDIRQSEMEELISIINNGKELVVKCSKISTINLVGKVRYSKELIDLDNSLLRYFMTTLSLDNFKVSKEILVAVTRLGVKLVGDDHKDRGVFNQSEKSQASYAKITPGTSKLAHVAQRTLQPPIIFLEKSGYRELSEIAEQAKRLAEVARLRELLTLKGRVESVLKLKRLDIGIMEQQYYYSI